MTVGSLFLVGPSQQVSAFGIDNIVYDIPVGGEIFSINTIPLLIEGINANSYSILGVFTMLGAAAFGALYYTSKRQN